MFKKFILFVGLFFSCCANASVVSDIEFDITVQNIIKSIDPKLKYELFIIKSNQENAFTTIDKNGNIIIAVYTGLIKSLSAEEFVGVLCHEIGHIHHKHVIKMMHLISKNKTTFNILGLLSLIPYINLIPMIILSAESNNLMIHSQQNEIEADIYCFNKLNQLKWPVEGIVNMFDRWSYGEKRCYFSSHPWSSSRKKMAEKFIVKSHKLPRNISSQYNQMQSRIKKELYEGGSLKYATSNDHESAWFNYLSYKYQINDQLKEDCIQYPALILKAKILAKQGKYEEAINIMDKVHSETKNMNALFQRIYWNLLFSTKISNKNLLEIQNYQKMNPNDSRALELFAYYYSKQNNRTAFLYYKAEYSLSNYNIKKAKYYINEIMKNKDKNKNSTFLLRAIELKKAIK
ncbi:M48 family metalloprotease [Candidatus Cytomitobacter indipagum]|uniref:M48 family metalloprotease n=1 Tax=Candidatus Cytomitobacter indipagum TaxID=2601575 RepID=A0A5C0UFU0_9PROT|nr:M48 family metalloprotease [Candidatus Cytomitobacter indipagum]QEK38122.1 M48 family metalloprotease [Candidatus Cytomitobacter indipagum]